MVPLSLSQRRMAAPVLCATFSVLSPSVLLGVLFLWGLARSASTRRDRVGQGHSLASAPHVGRYDSARTLGHGLQPSGAPLPRVASSSTADWREGVGSSAALAPRTPSRKNGIQDGDAAPPSAGNGSDLTPKQCSAPLVLQPLATISGLPGCDGRQAMTATTQSSKQLGTAIPGAGINGRPVVFFDVSIGDQPAGRIKMELYSDIVPKCVGRVGRSADTAGPPRSIYTLSLISHADSGLVLPCPPPYQDRREFPSAMHGRAPVRCVLRGRRHPHPSLAHHDTFPFLPRITASI